MPASSRQCRRHCRMRPCPQCNETFVAEVILPRKRRDPLVATAVEMDLYHWQFRQDNPGCPWPTPAECRHAVEDALFFRWLWGRELKME